MAKVYSPTASEIVREYRKRFTPAEDKPSARSQENLQEQPEHEMVLTAKRNSNGKILVVRCVCKAEYRNVSRRYYNYDPLGEADSLDAAVDLYRQHLLPA